MHDLDRDELEARLHEAEETLNAIRNGEVDAVVVHGPAGQQVYTLSNADRPYRALIEQMQEGAVTLSGDGTVLYCNQRFAAIAGLPGEAVLGQPIQSFLAAADGETFRDFLALGRDVGVSGEFVLMSQTGAEVPVNISLADLKLDDSQSRIVCGIVTDLTQSHQRRRELAAANARLASEIEERRRAEESLRLALDASGMGIWDVDLADGTSRRSLRHDRIYGYQEPLPSWPLLDALAHFVPEDQPLVFEAYQTALRGGVFEVEARIRRRDDDSCRWLHVKGQTYYAGGKPVRLAGIIADITDRRTVEEQLRQAQKMEAMGQLTGGVAHDFNNLLMVIGGSLDMLSRRIAPDRRTERLFEAARQGVARGAKLNQQLLAFSRRQELRAEVVCVDELIPTFEHLLDRAVGETVTVRLERNADLWSCRIDAHQLETAVLNLVINARDAMPDGGSLVLSTENQTVDHGFAAAWEGNAGDYVVMSIADTGTGMTPEVIARAFEPFFTTKETGKGTGLGLSQVYGFAKQSGGFVTIESSQGTDGQRRGTIVRIFLPRTDARKAAAAPAAPAGAPVLEGHGVVLVVEDDADVRATASGMLRDLGYVVHAAKTGRSALAFVAAGRPPVDLVFSDVIMPDGMSGVDLAHALDTLKPGLPVLLTSGYTAQRCAAEPAAEERPLLRKPYTQPELSQAVRAALGSVGATRRELSQS
jgi:PAS domain S-box-containing protein